MSRCCQTSKQALRTTLPRKMRIRGRRLRIVFLLAAAAGGCQQEARSLEPATGDPDRSVQRTASTGAVPFKIQVPDDVWRT